MDLKREDSDVVGNVLRKTATAFVARIGGDGTGWSKGRYRFVNNTIITTTGSGAVFRLFDRLESVEMHNNVIVVNGTGGPAIMRAVAGEFMWVNGTNIAGSNNWVSSGSTNVPSQWTGTIRVRRPGSPASPATSRPVAGSPLVDAGAANLAGPTGFAFPSPLWPPAFQPPLQTLAAVGTAEARPADRHDRHRGVRAWRGDARRGRHERRRGHGRRRRERRGRRHERRGRRRHGRRGRQRRAARAAGARAA